MSGQCIEKTSHVCGTKNGRQIFANEDGSVSSYCFSCSTYEANPYGEPKKTTDFPEPKVKTPQEIAAEIAEISLFPVLDIPSKKLRATSLEKFGVHVGVSERDGKTPELLYYPYEKDGKLVGYKVKLLPKGDMGKKIWSIGQLKDCDAFGWSNAISKGAKRLIITEGEDDAISWDRIIELCSDPEYKDYTAVVSIPHGAAQAKNFIVKNLKEITNAFKEIYLSFDMDEVGREAIKEVCMVLPQAKSITLPGCKDANECLVQGKAKATFSALFNAVVPKNGRLIKASDIAIAAMSPAQYGELTWPWPHIQKDTKGIRLGETIYIGGPVKCGKSELVNALAAHFIKSHKVKVFLAKPEEEVKHSYKMLANKMVGRRFHDPDVPFDKEAYSEAMELIGDNAYFLDVWQDVTWNNLKEDIIVAVNDGVKAVFIDPITNLTSGTNSAEANVELEKISQDISVMAKDMGFVAFLFCHLKASEGNISIDRRNKFYHEGKYIGLGQCPHEMGGDINSNQFAGSRSMMRKCNMMIGLGANKDPELSKEVRNIRNIQILEDRNWGITGIYPVYWNEETTLFKEIM